MPRTILNHANRRRRVPGWTSVALMLLLASTAPSSSSKSGSLVEAFVLPKQRVRVQPSTMAVRSAQDKKKASAEFGGDDEKRDEGIQKKHNGKELRNGSKPPPGSPLSMICEEAAEEDSFDIHVGRALDTLRKDYPHMLTDRPG